MYRPTYFRAATPQFRSCNKCLVPLISCCLIFFLACFARAGSATWDLNPGSGDWNTATNWTPATVPNGPADTATFALSNTTSVSLSADTEVDTIMFNPGASVYTVTAEHDTAGEGVILTIERHGHHKQFGSDTEVRDSGTFGVRNG